ncbi:MAG: hypothetical protein ACI9QD_000535 [Thermoproteota archaeon]|jgi:uncharacterized protein YggE
MKAIFLFLCLINFAHAATEIPRVIQVSGKCELNTEPDRGRIIFNIIHTHKNIKTVTNKSKKLYDKLLKEIKSLKLKKAQLSTSNYNVQEKNEWRKSKNVFIGFTASIGLKLETSDITKISKAIGVANSLGVTNIGNLTTYLSLEKKNKLSLKCLKIAAKNAYKKAELLASTLDAKVGKVINIIEGSPDIPRFPVVNRGGRMENKSIMSYAGSGPKIQAGKSLYAKNITVSFKLE